YDGHLHFVHLIGGSKGNVSGRSTTAPTWRIFGSPHFLHTSAIIASNKEPTRLLSSCAAQRPSHPCAGKEPRLKLLRNVTIPHVRSCSARRRTRTTSLSPPTAYNPRMSYKTLLVEEADGVLTVTLNRPDVHNAFNDELIAEAIDVFRGIGSRDARAVILRGMGPNFCAGADLNWMSRMVRYSRDENVRDSSNLARMYAVINECPLPVIGRIQGAAIGGGVGLVAVCDIAICSADAK